MIFYFNQLRNSGFFKELLGIFGTNVHMHEDAFIVADVFENRLVTFQFAIKLQIIPRWVG